MFNFYPRSPCGERRPGPAAFPARTQISIHALLAESDLMWYQCNTVVKISIHALLAESDYYMQWDITDTVISIHALLAESDKGLLSASLHKFPISIHALLAESDAPQGCCTLWEVLFLSTLSLRRATWVLMGGLSCDGNFYPRSPCGERPPRCGWFEIVYYFYPRSPCGERPSNIVITSQ